jgi:regulator of protease activity HflC (stomatin/prohibitin superfamily)
MDFNPKKVGIIVAAVVLLAIVGLFGGALVETNNAGNVQLKQAAVTGNLTCKLEPGMWMQLFGSIHTYKEATTFHFSSNSERGDSSLPTRFSDATKAQVSGTVRVLLPVTDCDALVRIHRKFKGFGGVMARLVEPAMRKSLFHAGPHMTAAESYAERRGEFATLAEDQLINGVIKVDQIETDSVDLITGEKTVIKVVTPRVCSKENGTTCVGGFERDVGVFREFGISLTNFVIDGISYPDNVMAQIESQRKARMNIITQEAEAKEAEARAKKAKSEAEAAIEETRAKEEIAKTQRIVKAEADKAEAVLQAEKVKAVSKLEMEAAEYEKKKLTKLGEGEANRKRLAMQADGALRAKLDAQVKIQQYWADAYSKRNVPQTVFGGGSGTTGHGDGDVQMLIKMLTAKTANDLSLDMRTKGNTNK